KIVYTLEDAMERDERREGTGSVREGSGVGTVDDDGAVRAPRRIPTDWVQVGASLQGAGRRRPEGVESSPQDLSASAGRRDRGTRTARAWVQVPGSLHGGGRRGLEGRGSGPQDLSVSDGRRDRGTSAAAEEDARLG